MELLQNEALSESIICDNISKNDFGHLTFANFDVAELANKYSTPLMLFDDEKAISNANVFSTALSTCGGFPLYAGKALSIKHIYKLLKPLNFGIDVVSCGEIATAKAADFPLEKAFFHGNSKTDSDIAFAIKNDVGYFVVDNLDELLSVDKIAGEMGKIQKILLRITAGIDPHTFAAVNTASIDTKFGTAVSDKPAFDITKKALELENISLCGFHCHIGSQIFDCEPFINEADIMLDFMAEVRDRLRYTAKMLNLGGGFAVRYLTIDAETSPTSIITSVIESIRKKCSEKDYPFPTLLFEPGRAIVANAGMTVYTVCAVKKAGNKNYVLVDGGMTDNPRFALYGSKYTVILANRALLKPDFCCTIGGRCCESGDIIAENIYIPKPKRGDLIAVCTTGAYNYSMASIYNRVSKPPIVSLSKKGDRLIVRRETLQQIIENDL